MQTIGMEYRKVSTLVPYAENARVHSESQVEDIARSIEEFGFVNPILVDTHGEIIAGHGRLMAASLVGLEEVPVIVVSHLSDDKVRALRLADNRIALSSSWDIEKLSAELSALAEDDFDLSVIGFDDQELENLLGSDESIIPDSYRNDALQVEQGTKERRLPSSDNNELQEVRPRSSDDHHSNFELVMLHSNKLRLVEVLNEIRNRFKFGKTEDALMWMCDRYEEEKGE